MLGTSVQAQAQPQPADAARCSERDLEALRRAWKIEPDVTVHDAARKPWPDDARLRLTALVYDQEAGESMGPRSGWLALAVVNAKTQRIVSRGREVLEEDAMLRFGKGLVTLDTARYRLAPGIRAFGVALRLQNRARCVDGGIDGQWRLFVPEGAAIRAVTNGGSCTCTRGALPRLPVRRQGRHRGLPHLRHEAARRHVGRSRHHCAP